MRESGGHGVGLRKGFWEGGILRHVWLVLLQRVAEARQHRMLGVELAVPRYQHGGQNWGRVMKKMSNQNLIYFKINFLGPLFLAGTEWWSLGVGQ